MLRCNSCVSVIWIKPAKLMDAYLGAIVFPGGLVVSGVTLARRRSGRFRRGEYGCTVLIPADRKLATSNVR
ncbi:MAG: hypothetical protein A3G25_20150 [Betaproteobacteria bacterium RIFCSPLOWO2_12_FULL_63_13]|nr:MAG: hypothetical protein A3H32_06425 [Betaproteobacteria bacterium RIFCSPLOWO2_02_FULL_63_19]OGA51321.1 MAG: hypothetical protein A3G25_20150 [Betaproteobacteria bacterium RIFCSPLOWO2_12_FULL_63_13]